MINALLIAALVLTLVVLPIALVRTMVDMVRGKHRAATRTSGIAGAMFELDRIVRPSVVNVVEAEECADKEVDGVGGE